MTRTAVWFPDEITSFDSPVFTFPQAKEVNPNYTWNFALWRPRGGIGDMLMLTPCFKTIKENFPKCKLTLITSFRYLDGALKEILWGNPYLDRVIDQKEMTHKSPENNFHIIANMDCPCRAHEEPGRYPPNRIDLFTNSIGLVNKDPKVFYKVKDEEKRWITDFLRARRAQERKPLMMYQPFASSQKRSPDVQQSKNILGALRNHWPNCGIFVPTHGSDWAPETNFNLLNCEHLKNYNVRLLAALISICDVVIAPDSSILHLAGALNIPLVGLFGPTVPESRMNYYPKSIALNLGKHFCKGGYPCVVGSSYVSTSNGYRPIKDIQVGEQVKTANGDYHKVIKLHKNKLKGRKLYQIEFMGTNEPIVITEDHKMFVMRRKTFKASFIKSGTQRRGNTTKPFWEKAKNIKKSDYLCLPRNKPEEEGKGELNSDLAWLYGLYVAEGYTKNQKETKNTRNKGKVSTCYTCLCLNADEHELFKKIDTIVRKHNLKNKAVKNKGISFDKNKNSGNSVIVQIHSKKFTEEIRRLFGRVKAKEKRIPHSILKSTDECLRAFLGGLFAGDGCTSPNGELIYTTASKQLAYGIQEAHSRFGEFGKIYKRRRATKFTHGKKTIIYRVYIHPISEKKQTHWKKDDNYLYVPIKRIEEAQKQEFVYDITVEDDPTFTIGNVATYDCWYGSCSFGRICWKSMKEDDVIEAVERVLEKKFDKIRSLEPVVKQQISSLSPEEL